MKACVFPGSFDPITGGHLSAIIRARELFDEVWVLVADNPEKKYVLSLDKRIECVQDTIKEFEGVSCAHTSGLVVDWMRTNKVEHIVRGIRDASDAIYELKIAEINKRISRNVVETIFVTTHEDYKHVSSSLVRELARNGRDVLGMVSYKTAMALCDVYKK